MDEIPQRAGPQALAIRERVRGNLAVIRERIERRCREAGRDPSSVRLLPATKYADTGTMKTLYDLGLRTFGENQVQAALDKASGLPSGIRWVMIGHLQRNKVAKALRLFSEIHSVDSVRLAEAISRRLAPGRSLPVLVEVNVSGEAPKTGLDPEAFPSTIREILEVRGLDVRGLLGMGPWEPDPEASRPAFRRLRQLRDEARAAGIAALPELSMGMSHDFEIAIEEGATIVRIGSALFGDATG